MYEAFFGLARRPFPSVPCTESYFPATGIESARQVLTRCIERSEGVGLLIGPSGTGKSLLCRMLAESFRGSFDVVFLSSGRLGTRKALMQAILFELGQPYRGMDEGELRLALADYLTSSSGAQAGMLLVVDEAHTLSPRLLEEIRTITNLVCDGQPRTRLVLSGSAALEERLASPKLESFSQRIAARCYLEPLNRTETEQYVWAQIEGAGGQGRELFPPESCEAVYHATDGVPRLINQVCDHALLLAYADGCPEVDKGRVERAWADLQQLPTPFSADDQQEAEQVVIEFGRLDDDDEEAADEGDSEVRCLPMLRVADLFDEPEEPAVQVEAIQGALDDLDQPPEAEAAAVPQTPGRDAEAESPGDGAIEGEGETEKPVDIEGQGMEAENPFDEPFQEEEVIIERFGGRPESPEDELVASATDGQAASAPREIGTPVPEPAPPVGPVSGQLDEPALPFQPLPSSPPVENPFQAEAESEGSELTQAATQGLVQVETYFDQPAQWVWRTDAFGPHQGLPAEIEGCVVDENAASPAPAAADSPGAPAGEEGAHDESPGWSSQPQTVPMHRGAGRGAVGQSFSEAHEEPEDKDLIVVEEGYGDFDGLPRRVARVRVQQYKQLFATLRRGRED
ncbi:MAG TPA: AAA family ATPase [Planctomycetes bacterium]|nr:AAA family ATPase [Planctomycetota bacterium]